MVEAYPNCVSAQGADRCQVSETSDVVADMSTFEARTRRRYLESAVDTVRDLPLHEARDFLADAVGYAVQCAEAVKRDPHARHRQRVLQDAQEEVRALERALAGRVAAANAQALAGFTQMDFDGCVRCGLDEIACTCAED